MKIVKIVTPYGYFTVGREGVTNIFKHEFGHYVIQQEKDRYNVGTLIEVHSKEILVYFE
jgi:hypothetical protein